MLFSCFSRSIWISCCIAVLAEPQPQAPPESSGGIAGIAVDAQTKAPIRRAIITLSTVESSPQDAVAWTDANGRFWFSYLPPGRYQLRPRKDGYQGLAYGAKTATRPAGTIQLAAGETRADLVLRLQRTSSISGVVLGDDGEPVGYVLVAALRLGFQRQKRKLLPGPSANTDRDGRYRISGLAPGPYAVMVSSSYRVVSKLSSNASPKQPQSTQQYTFGTQYYPGTDQPESAAALELSPGQDAAEIDFRLTARPTVRLTGKLLVPPGFTTTDHVIITVMNGGLGNWNQLVVETRPPDFAFQLDNLLPGSYVVVAQASVGGKQYRGVQPIKLEPQGLEDLVVTMDPAIDLMGSVSVEGPDASKYVADSVTLISGDDFMPNSSQVRAKVNKDGTFKLTGVLPGIWDIDARPLPPGGYIKSMSLGDHDVLTKDMVIRSSTTATLKVVLSTQAARLDGTVTQGPGALVVLAPEAKLRHVQSFYRFAFADEKGHFEIKGATPGRYLLYAFEDVDQQSIQDPNFLRPFESAGVPITLSEGPNQTQKLSLLPGVKK